MKTQFILPLAMAALAIASPTELAARQDVCDCATVSYLYTGKKIYATGAQRVQIEIDNM